MVTGIDDLSNMHLDVLKEIGNIGAGNAITALSKLLNRKVDMEVPKVKILEFHEVSETLGGAEIPVVGIMLKVTGDLTGNITFILRQKDAATRVHMLMGKPPETDLEFSELEISALKEIGNILTGSYLSALSGLTNLKMMPSIPDLAIDMAGAILSVPAIEFGKIGDKALLIESEFGDEIKAVNGYFILIPTIESYSAILSSLGL